MKLTTSLIRKVVREEINRTVKEMSTTGTGAGFSPGQGGQYATPKAFKKHKKRTTEN